MLLYGTGGGGWWRGPKSEPPIGGVRSFRLALWPALLTTLLTTLLTRQRASVRAGRATYKCCARKRSACKRPCERIAK